MKQKLFSIIFTIPVVLLGSGFLCGAYAMNLVDGVPAMNLNHSIPVNSFHDYSGRAVDIVGSTSYSGSGTGRAKGNSYQIDTSVFLTEMEFWLDFSDTQTLTYYVFDCPDEFGTYTEVYRNSESVGGSGEGWYSSGTVNIDLNINTHYIIVVSWNGSMGYYFDSAESQATSFGAQTHGYAAGYHPLPGSFDSLTNDTAIYHQRLTTTVNTALDRATWGGIKAVF